MKFLLVVLIVVVGVLVAMWSGSKCSCMNCSCSDCASCMCVNCSCPNCAELRTEGYETYNFVKECSNACKQPPFDNANKALSCYSACIDAKCSYACDRENDCTMECVRSNDVY